MLIEIDSGFIYWTLFFASIVFAPICYYGYRLMRQCLTYCYYAWMIGEARGVLRENRDVINDAAAWVGCFAERIEGHINSAVRYRMVRTEATSAAEQIGNLVAMCVDRYAENKAKAQKDREQLFSSLRRPNPVMTRPVCRCPYTDNVTAQRPMCVCINNKPNMNQFYDLNTGSINCMPNEPSTYLPVNTPLPRCRPTAVPTPIQRGTYTYTPTPAPMPKAMPAPVRVSNIQGPSIWDRAANWGLQAIKQVNVPALATAYTTYLENQSKDPVQLLVSNLFQSANLAQNLVNEQKPRAAPAPFFTACFRTEAKPTESCVPEPRSISTDKVDTACDEVKSIFRARGLEDPSLNSMIDCIAGKLPNIDFTGGNIIDSMIDVATSVAEEMRGTIDTNSESFNKTINTISEIFKETLNGSDNSNEFPDELRALFNQLPKSQSPAPEEIKQDEPTIPECCRSVTPECESEPETRCDSPMPEFMFNMLQNQAPNMGFGNIFASIFGLPYNPMMGEMESSESSGSGESCDMSEPDSESDSESDDCSTGSYSVCSMDADITDCSVDERVDSPALD